MHVGIIGAGAAASAAAYVLDQTTDADITILEKSGGLCGRAATRRRDGIVYDYGANYLKDDSERVVSLVTETLDTEGLDTISEPIWVFDCEGTVTPGRDTPARRFTYDRGLTQIAKRLLDRTDATVHRRTRVEHITRTTAGWTLTDEAGTDWGPFDRLLCNPPAPQTAALLQDADWDDPRREELADALSRVPYRTVWTAVLGYEGELDVPYYALINPDKTHELGWIAREACKPGHVPAGQSVLVVQANHEWSTEHYEHPPEQNLDAIAALTADVIGDDRLATPAWTDHQGWRYALPEGSPPQGPLRRVESAGLYCLGDWVTGDARLHAALENGLAAGERIALSADSQ